MKFLLGSSHESALRAANNNGSETKKPNRFRRRKRRQHIAQIPHVMFTKSTFSINPAYPPRCTKYLEQPAR